MEKKDNAALQNELNELLKDCADEETRRHLQYLCNKNFDSFESVDTEIEKDPAMKKTADTKNCIPFADRMESICALPQKTNDTKDGRVRKTRKFARVMAIAASFVILLGVGIVMRYLIFAPANSGKPDYDYSDSEITVRIATEQEIKSVLRNKYSPDFDMLSDAEYRIGKHNTSHEAVYISVSGDYESEGVKRKIVSSIYLQENYTVTHESDYQTDNTVSIAGKTVSVYETRNGSDILYSCGFALAATRYYTDLYTSIENDYLGFLTAFL